jgi:hypothetical protein
VNAKPANRFPDPCLPWTNDQGPLRRGRDPAVQPSSAQPGFISLTVIENRRLFAALIRTTTPSAASA